MKKFLAAIGTAAVIFGGATACGNQPAYSDSGYEQVWDGGQYVMVPDSYYNSHRSLYNNHAHPARHRSSSYVTSHHVTVEHRTTTTRHTTTTRKSFGSTRRHR